jgi:TonB family protein
MISEACYAPQFRDAAGANVIAFSRRDQAMPVVNAGDRPATSARTSSFAWLLLVASMAAHAGIVAAFAMRPRPLSNAGIPAITVEIVLGDNATAGLASSQGQEAATEVRPADATPAEATALVPEMVRPATAVEAMAVARTPDSSPAQAQPEDVRSELEEIPPEQIASVSKPTRPRAQTPSSAAGGISRGGSAADANYHGRVAAHLARHKRFPSDARRRGEHGSAGIDFTIDGRGRVTAVRIARSSGHISLDRAAEAMVWRASPFPAPPDGRPRRFSVPVSYSIR